MKLTYGIPMFVMKKYLTDLGATEAEENVMIGDQWQAILSKAEPARIGSLVVGRLDVEVSGDEEAVKAMLDKLHWKTLRGGG